MKVIAKKLNKNQVVLAIETLDDLWILYNIIAAGDQIEGKTSRRIVVTDREDDTGERRMVYLKIVVEQVEFHEFANRLRAKGKIIEGPEDVTLNTYHTFNIEENTVIGITKDDWTPTVLRMIDEAARHRIGQKVLVVAIDSGEATFAEIGDYYQKTSMSLTENIPGKRYGDVKDSVNARNMFFADVLKMIETMATGGKYSKIVITGPGFTREHFMEHCLNKNPSLKPVLITEASSSASSSGIRELLKKQTIQGFLKDARIIQESAKVEEFFARLGKESGLAAYGIKEIQKAAEMGAIEDLLVTDDIIRKINVEKDLSIIALLKSVETTRGRVMIVSTLHDAGKQIQGMGGLAALLRFKTEY
nr:mRNA surveillance protein pelota [Candidatus Sigynarchaeota archaeon]